MSPPGLPIFKEIDRHIAHRLSLIFAYQSSMLGSERSFDLTTSVQTVGYTATENWVAIYRGGFLRLRRLDDD
jgi:hypothetical protein